MSIDTKIRSKQVREHFRDNNLDMGDVCQPMLNWLELLIDLNQTSRR